MKLPKVNLDKPCECGHKRFNVKHHHKRYYGQKDKGWMMDLLICCHCKKVYKKNYIEFEDIKYK